MLRSCLLVLEANRKFGSSPDIHDGKGHLRKFVSEANLSDLESTDWENTSTASLPTEVERIENVVGKLKKRQKRINAALSAPSLLMDFQEHETSTWVIHENIYSTFSKRRFLPSSIHPIDVDRSFSVDPRKCGRECSSSSEAIDVDRPLSRSPQYRSQIIDVDEIVNGDWNEDHEDREDREVEDVVLTVIRDLDVETTTMSPLTMYRRIDRRLSPSVFCVLRKEQPLRPLAPVGPPPSLPNRRFVQDYYSSSDRQ